MSAGFTPGPWIVDCLAICADQGADTICLMGEIDGYESGYKPLPNREANARLIAAAPELVDALEEAYRFITQPTRMDTPKGGPKTATYRTENYNALTTKLRAALAKARGEA